MNRIYYGYILFSFGGAEPTPREGSVILKGVRGGAKADIDAAAEAIARLSVFADKNADVIDSIDVNPLLVLAEGEGAVALDGLIATKG